MISFTKQQLIKIAKYVLMAILIPVAIGYYNHITAIRVINTIQLDLGVELQGDYDFAAIEYAHNNGHRHPLDVHNNVMNYWISGIRSVTYTIHEMTQ